MWSHSKASSSLRKRWTRLVKAAAIYFWQCWLAVNRTYRLRPWCSVTHDRICFGQRFSVASSANWHRRGDVELQYCLCWFQSHKSVISFHVNEICTMVSFFCHSFGGPLQRVAWKQNCFQLIHSLLTTSDIRIDESFVYCRLYSIILQWTSSNPLKL